MNERATRSFSHTITELLARGHDPAHIVDDWADCFSAAPLSTDLDSEAPAQSEPDEWSALQAVRQAALTVLALDLADRLGVHAWAVETILRNMPAEYIDLLDDIDDMTILADAVGALLGRPIDPDHPLFNPSIH